MFAADLTNPDFFSDGELVLPRDTLHIRRLKFMWRGSCHERVVVRNFDARSRSAVLTLLRVRFRRSIRGARAN
jgi:hypothetical protein